MQTHILHCTPVLVAAAGGAAVSAATAVSGVALPAVTTCRSGSMLATADPFPLPIGYCLCRFNVHATCAKLARVEHGILLHKLKLGSIAACNQPEVDDLQQNFQD